MNIVPHLSGEVKTPPHERLLWRMHGKQSFAIREGNWKLIRTGEQPPELYDLAADPGDKEQRRRRETPKSPPASPRRWRHGTKNSSRPSSPAARVKNEDWGPGGANQKGQPAKKPAPAKP